MTVRKEMRALFPDDYPKQFTLAGKKAIRLFGSNWTSGIIGERQGLSDNDHWRFRADKFYAFDPKDQGDEAHFHQTIFAVNIYGTNTYHEKYPLRGEQPIRDDPELLIQRIHAPGGNEHLFQLLQGRLEIPVYEQTNNEETRHRRTMLERMRAFFGLAKPTREQLSIYLYADGFCIFGAAALPWSDDPIDGWFKLTNRGVSVPGAPSADTTGGLVLCFDPALPENNLAAWQERAEGFQDIFDGGSLPKAQWLDVNRSSTLDAREIFWAGDYVDGKPYFKRSAADPLQLETRFLRVRVSPGRSAAQKITGMEIGSERLIVERSAAGGLSVGTHGPMPQSELRYRYARAENLEELNLGSGDDGRTELALAVPLIESAAALRAESGLPEGRMDLSMGTQKDPVGPLWTFTPIENGLLHWPFPDATFEGIETLLEAEEPQQPTPAPTPQRAPPVGGAMLLGNEPNLPDFQPKHRRWELAITDGEEGWFRLEFTRPDRPLPETDPRKVHWYLSGAQVSVAKCAVVLDGAFPVIPFRQTEDRLLPDHDERALRSRSLRAVSPSLLRGLEARMWLYADKLKVESKRRRVQAKLIVRDFRLVAGSSDGDTLLQGRVQLECTIHSRESSNGAPDPALRPWLWTRFDKLATAQLVPLAVSGEAALQPSGSRQLHPLVRVKPSARLTYSFENALDMAVSSPRLVTDGELDGGWRYQSPVYSQAWLSEVGMAVLTLPSMTIFPGVLPGKDLARIPAAKVADQWFWPLGNGQPELPRKKGVVPYCIELRHDLAWCDERYATAQRAPAEGDEGSARGTFEPQPRNGPQDSLGTTSFAAAWERADRLAALAATDDRELVRWNGKTNAVAHTLGGFMGAVEHPVLALDFLHDLEIETISTTPEDKRLRRAGSIEISLEIQGRTSRSQPEKQIMRLEGLPSNSDLSGFSGVLDGRLYRFGTLVTGRGEAEDFVDQRGLRSGQFSTTGDLAWRVVDGAKIYSMRAPLDADFGGTAIRFWFVDLPANPEPAPSPQAWADFSNNHRQGFRWSIEQQGGKLDGCLHWRNGIYFEPLKLRAFTATDLGTYSLAVSGRLGLLVNGKFVPQILEKDGDHSTFTLDGVTTSGNTEWTCKLDARPAKLRLEVSGQEGAPPALLSIDTDLRKAVLNFDLFGQPAQVRLVVKEASAHLLRFGVAEPETADVALSRAVVDLTADGPTLDLAWTYRFASRADRALDLMVEGSLPHPRYSHGSTPPMATVTLGGGEEATVWNVMLSQWYLDGSFLALTWAGSKPKHEERAAEATWLGLFKDSGHSGALLALVRPSTGTTGFTARDFRLDWEAGLDSLLLRVEARHSRIATATLHGELAVRNTEGSKEYDHEATMRFDGSRVPDGGAKTRVAAHLLHKLTGADVADRPEVGFATVQWVTFKRRPDGVGQIDFPVAMIAETRSEEEALLVLLPARDLFKPKDHQDEERPDPPSEDGHLASCHRLPPLSAAVRASAQRALADAFAGPGEIDGWAGRLLESRIAGALALRSGEGGGLSLLFEQAGKSEPRVYSLALPQRWRVPAGDPGYTQYLALLAAQLSAILLAAPSRFLMDRDRQGYVLWASDVHAEGVIQVAREASVPLESGPAQFPALVRWAKRLLASKAPWAPCGILTAYATADSLANGADDAREGVEAGGARFLLVERRVASEEKVRPISAPWQPEIQVVRDVRLADVPDAGQDLDISYIPTAARAIDLSYRTGGVEGEDADQVRLAAHAMQRMWQLSGPAATKLHYRADRDFWVGTRQGVAFRPAAKWTADDRLTPMLSEGAAVAAASAMVPATRLTTAPAVVARPLSQYYAPAQMILRDVSPRPGVWHLRRMGLSSRLAQATESRGPAIAIAAPELPFHARTPRPPVTGVNDRLRASEFEPSHFQLSAEPSFVLHGPRAQPPHVPGPPPALTRTPLSQSAWLGKVVKPIRGLIDSGWDGTLLLRLASLSAPSSSKWSLKSARALIEGRSFDLHCKGVPASDASLQDFLVSSASSSTSGEGGASFVDHVGRLRLSTRARIECEFEFEDSPRILRQAAFELLVAPQGGAGVEQPFHLRFEDPAYNDRLTLPSKFAADTGQAIFCADRDNVRRDDRLTVAWRRVAGGEDPPVPAEFFRWIERKVRKADGTFESLTIKLKPIQASGGGFEAWAVIDCARLPIATPGVGFAELQIGDRLAVSAAPPVAVGDVAGPAATLYFDVSSERLFPANPSAFALLCLHEGDEALSAPLYAQSPTPMTIELVDPRDLFNGVARFRAAYQWIHFAASGQGEAVRYFVQKIGGDGGSYLAEPLGEWLPAPKASN